MKYDAGAGISSKNSARQHFTQLAVRLGLQRGMLARAQQHQLLRPARLQAAAQLLSRRGYAATSTNEVALRAMLGEIVQVLLEVDSRPALDLAPRNLENFPILDLGAHHPLDSLLGLSRQQLT